MRSRGQLAAALAIVVLVVGGGLYVDREVGARALEAGPPGRAPSGAWFCPHSGGTDWTAALELANPGADPVLVRVSNLGTGRPSAPRRWTVDPASTLEVPVTADGREASSVVEYFGGWVAASWVEHGGGEDTGVAAEPCAPAAGGPWLVADASTLKGDDDELVVMNPFATAAVISITIYTDRHEPISLEGYTHVPIAPFRSESFRLNRALGYEAVGARVDVEIGRVAVATLDASKDGGIRSTLGYLGTPPRTTILPAGFDGGRTSLEVVSSAGGRVEVQGEVLDPTTSVALSELADTSPPGGSAQRFQVTTEGPSAIVVHADGAGLAAGRETFGISADQGSTVGTGAGAAAWVVLPAVAGRPNHPGLVLTNPAQVPAEVELSALPGGSGPPPGPVTVRIPAGRSVQAPKGWLEVAPGAAVLAIASSGTFVPAAASYSLGREGYATYAVALGVPIPQAWIPR